MAKQSLLALWIVVGILSPVAVQAAGDGVLKTAGKVLQIGVGARGEGMGEAMTAAIDDIYALYWNPAGLENVRAPQVTYAHNLWIADVQNGYLAYAQPMWRGGIGVGFNYINFGEFEKYGVDNYGYPVPLNSSFTPYTLVITGGYGAKVASFMSAGLNLKLVSESADTYNGFTLAADLGAQFPDVLEGLDLGVAVQNLGIPMAGYQLPLVGKAGFAYHIPWLLNEKTDRFTLAVDANIPVPTDQPMYVNAGLEYFYWNTLALRAGYRQSENNANLGDGLVGLTAGAGFRYANITLDYAVAGMGELGMTHRISLSYAFDTPKKRVRKRRKVSSKLPYSPNVQVGTRDSGGDSGMLMPSLSKLSMRKPLNVTVDASLDSSNKSRVARAVFTVEVKGDKQVDKWVLKIQDAKGHVVWSTGSEGLPESLEWNGKDRAGRIVPESVFCTYEFNVVLDDGSTQSAGGKVVGEGGEARTADLGVQADQVKLPTIYFDEASSDLNEAAMDVLKQSAEKIKAKPYVRVLAEGFTDAGNEQEQSFLLSQKRVDSVVRYLTATYKIPLKTVSAHPRGSKTPAASNSTEDGRRQNRRVELTIIYKQ